MITPQVGKHRQISLLNNLLKLPERQQHEPPLCDWCLSELEGGTRLFEGPCKRKISKCTTDWKRKTTKRPQSEQLKTAHIFMWFFLLYTFSTKLLTPLPAFLPKKIWRNDFAFCTWCPLSSKIDQLLLQCMQHATKNLVYLLFARTAEVSITFTNPMFIGCYIFVYE